RLLAQALAQVMRYPLREASRVDEDQRRAVGPDQTRQAVVDVRPLLLGRHSLQVRRRHLDIELQVALVPQVDDDAGWGRPRVETSGIVSPLILSLSKDEPSWFDWLTTSGIRVRFFDITVVGLCEGGARSNLTWTAGGAA